MNILFLNDLLYFLLFSFKKFRASAHYSYLNNTAVFTTDNLQVHLVS